jgi:flagellar hook-basal body complex protein FliE
MALQSVYGPTGLPQSPPVSLRETKVAGGEMPFVDLIRELVQQTDQQQKMAQNGVQQLITGETDSIQDVVLTTSRADLAFRLMMEIRNRLIASYQEQRTVKVARWHFGLHSETSCWLCGIAGRLRSASDFRPPRWPACPQLQAQ